VSAPQVAGLSRRSWMALAGGVALLAAGTAGAMRREHGSTQPLTPVEAAFWQQKFSQIDGQMLSMAHFRGKPLVVNFWATWCPPCLDELPLLNAFYAENASKSWQVLGLAVDQLAPVKRFLMRSPLSFPVAMAGIDGTDLSRSLGNLSGGLPFTVVFGPTGDVRHRKIGRLSPSDLAAWMSLKLA
jgi:thiol-disulfide isomerase/thioredoxin